MNLFINSPAHYTQEYGIIDEIYNMCSTISRNINIKSYTDCIDTIGITPMIAPVDILSTSNWKERMYVSLTYQMCDISLKVDYQEFHGGDIFVKKQIILKNILDSLKVVKKKLKGKFDYEQAEKDILKLVGDIYENVF